MDYFVVWFTKITGYLPQIFFFKKKVYYINKETQNRRIKGGALIISNHYSIFDYALYMFVFLGRNLTVLIAKSTYYMNKMFTIFMKKLGSIIVDRKSYNFSFMSEIEKKLNKNKVVLFFPEGRLRSGNELENDELLDFKPSFVYVALNTNKPIIPVYTNGKYGFKNFFTKNRAKTIIGEKIYANDLLDDSKSEKENIQYICDYVKKYIEMLRDKLKQIEKEEKEHVPLIKRIFDPSMLFLDIVKFTGWPPVLFDLRLKRYFVEDGKIVKRPKDFIWGKYIICGNHSSYRDPVVIMNAFWERRINFVATKELFEGKVKKMIFTGFGCIEVNRDNLSMSTFKKIGKRLSNGHIVAIFPEGGIRKEEEIANFKSGSILFAGMNHCPIIPVYISKRNHWYERQRVYIGSKLKVDLGKIPSMNDINNMTKILRNEELKLKKVSGDKNE